MLNPSPPRLRSRNLELDFLRGVAILMVVDFHSPNQLLFTPFRALGFPHFGWAGVDLFFVLSGFLIGGLLMQEWKTRGRVEISRFLVRRCFKIMPQYYFYLVVVLITGHRRVHDLLGNLIHIQNYTNGIPHTWSLAVEEHAYLFLALLLTLAVAFRIPARGLFAFLLALVLALHALRLLLAIRGYPVYYVTHTRIDGILSGILLAMILNFEPALFTRLLGLKPLWFSLLAVALAFLRFQPRQNWANAVAFDAANLLGISLLMLLYGHRPARHTLARAYGAVAWIGIYSYGIYLWHVGLLAPLARVALRLPPPAAYLWNSLMPLLTAVAFGALMTTLIEFPMLRLRERWFPRSGPPTRRKGRELDPQPPQEVHPGNLQEMVPHSLS